MFRGVAKGDGRVVLLLGLSRANVERMQAGEPIHFTEPGVSVAEGLDGLEVVLFFGETEEEMATDLRRLVGPDTEVNVDPRLFGGGD